MKKELREKLVKVINETKQLTEIEKCDIFGYLIQQQKCNELLEAAYEILKLKELSWGEKQVTENEIKPLLISNGYIE